MNKNENIFFWGWVNWQTKLKEIKSNITRSEITKENKNKKRGIR